MPLVKTPLKTTNGIHAADGSALAGAKVVFELLENDVDSITNHVIVAAKQEFFLDNEGKLPADAAIWSNLRGIKKNKWRISVVRTSGTGTNAQTITLIQPVLINIPDSVTQIELVPAIISSPQWP